ncbi:hypothetical protein CC2G_015308 [Coprinopsis cinerea AmutBmut pab1-1]|nr:hypothetical protein CC2G_015308 [Coprinopsis cinerea AmutBmut pab1-1]
MSESPGAPGGFPPDNPASSPANDNDTRRPGSAQSQRQQSGSSPLVPLVPAPLVPLVPPPPPPPRRHPLERPLPKMPTAPNPSNRFATGSHQLNIIPPSSSGSIDPKPFFSNLGFNDDDDALGTRPSGGSEPALSYGNHQRDDAPGGPSHLDLDNQFLDGCVKIHTALGFLPIQLYHQAPPAAQLLLEQQLDPVSLRAIRGIESSKTSRLVLTNIRSPQTLSRQVKPSVPSSPSTRSALSYRSAHAELPRDQRPIRPVDAPPLPRHPISTPSDRLNNSRWSKPFSSFDSLLELANDPNSKASNPFRTAYVMARKGTFVPHSHISPLDKASQWLDWIGGIKHILTAQNLLGWIMLDNEVSRSTPEAHRPIYYLDNDDGGLTHDEYEFNAAWWTMDLYVRHYLTGPLSAAARQTLDDNIAADGIERPTSRDVYMVLKRKFGTLDYNHGFAAWERAKALEVGANVVGFITTFKRLISDVRRSPFDGTSPHLATQTFLNKLPKNSCRILLDNWEFSTIDGHVVPTDDWSEFIRWTEKAKSAHEGYIARLRSSGGTQARPPARPNSPPRPQGPRPPPKANVATAGGARPPNTRQAAVICYNCQKPGHTKANCSEPGGDLSKEGRSAKGYMAANGGDLDEEETEALDEMENDGIGDGDQDEPDDDERACIANALDALHLDFDTNNIFDFSPYDDLCDENVSVMLAQDDEYHGPPPSEPKSPPRALAIPLRKFDTILDSGCSQHIIVDRRHFHSFRNIDKSIGTAGATPLKALGIGLVKWTVTLTDGSTIVLDLPDCLYAPACPFNLLSTGRLCDINDVRLLFAPKRTVCWTQDPTRRQFFSFSRHGFITMLKGVFLRATPNVPAVLLSFITDTELPDTFQSPKQDIVLWHRRLGHPGWKTTTAIVKGKVVKGVVCTGSLTSCNCVPCIIGRFAQSNYPASDHRFLSPGDLVHMDISGPWRVKTPFGDQYFIAFLDDATHYGWVFLLKTRDGAFDAFLIVEARLENLTGRRIQRTRSDNAKELVAGRLGDHFKSKGVHVQTAAPYAHPQNGRAERHIRRLQDVSATMLAESGLPPSFWGFAIVTAQYLVNRLPSKALPENSTPFEALFGSKPDVSHLRVWGCRCFPIIPPELRKKGDGRRLRDCIFVGYGDGTKGYKVMTPTGKVFFSADVIFDEGTMGRLGTKRPLLSKDSPTNQLHEAIDTVRRVRRSARIANLPGSNIADGSLISPQSAFALLSVVGHDPSLPPLQQTPEFDTLPSIFAYLATVGIHRLFEQPSITPLSMMSACGFYCDALMLDEDDFNNSVAFRVIDLTKAPDTVKQAMSRSDWPAWLAAMCREFNSLKGRPAWEVKEKLPPGKFAIDVRWVFAFKLNPDGSIRWGEEKARLVVKGFLQRPNDYDETFAPVVKLAVVRIVLAITALRDYDLFSFDIKTAFLHSKLDDEVYIKQIPCFPLDNPEAVLRLLVVLYGLKQAAFAWYCHFMGILVKIGLKRCELDHAFFIGVWNSPPDPSIPMPADGSPLILLVPIHVDDGLASTNSPELYTWFIKQLKAHGIDVVDFGPVSMFLGIRVLRDRPNRRLWLSQSPFIQTLLDDWGMDKCRGVATPMEGFLDDLPDTDVAPFPFINPDNMKRKYQSLVGSLIYLATCTRPDIAYVAMSLGRHSADPKMKHLVAGKRVLRYLFETIDLVLLYDPLNDIHPSINAFIRSATGFSDADWASDKLTRISISGHVFFYLGGIVAWSSTRQRVIALSSTESEFYAIVNAMREGLWMRLFLLICNFPVPQPFPLICDNKSTLYQMESPAVGSKSKHVHIRELFAKQYFADGTFKAEWVATNVNVADIFTKPLRANLFERHRKALNLVRYPL